MVVNILKIKIETRVAAVILDVILIITYPGVAMIHHQPGA